MSAPISVEEYAKDIACRISCKNIGKSGTGFFVDNCTVLTCYHVVMDRGVVEREISIERDGNVYLGSVDTLRSQELNDIVFLTINESLNIYFHGLAVPELGQEYYSQSYVSDMGQSQPLATKYQGLEGEPRKFLKISSDTIGNGCSGSPLIDVKTGLICGMVTSSAHFCLPLGGWAIPFTGIVKSFPANDYNVFLQENQNKLVLLESAKDAGIGSLDASKDIVHYNLSPFDTANISGMFVNPIYEHVSYVDTDFCSHQIDDQTPPLVDHALNILEENRLLFVCGPYGSGKTIFCKMIQYVLNKNNYDTLYINAYNLSKYTPVELLHDIELRTSKNVPTIIVIDQFDDLLHITDREESHARSLIGSFFSALSSNRNLYLIINFRHIGLKDSLPLTILNILFQNITNKNKIDIINIEYFDNRCINKWLENYWKFSPKHVDDILNLNMINSLHKSLLHVCRIPLFLYIFALKYYSSNMHEQSIDIYSLYRNFVKQTITGKFKRLAPVLDRIHNNYEQLLVSFAVICTRTPSNNKFDPYAHICLDKNDEVFSIKSSQLTPVISNILRDLLSFDQILPERLKYNIINCYFFSATLSGYCFRDNNFVYYFISTLIINAIKKALVNKYNDVCNYQKIFLEDVQQIKGTRLHPMVFEFTLQHIESFEQFDKNSLSEIIMNLFKSGMIANVKDSLFFENLSPENLSYELLLFAIYLKYKTALQSNEHYIKRFLWFISAAKHLDNNYLYACQRFFKDITLKNVGLTRISFDGYNFKNSVFSSVVFKQCSFRSPNFWGNNFSDTDFKQSFVKFKLENCKGELCFENCEINELIVEDCNDLALSFSTCAIHKLHIQSRNRNYFLVISISNSKCSAITVSHVKVKEFRLLESVAPSIRVTNADIDFYSTVRFKIAEKGSCNIRYC